MIVTVVIHYTAARGAPVETAVIELKPGADWADVCNEIRARLFPELALDERDAKHDEVMRRRAAASRAKYEEERRR